MRLWMLAGVTWLGACPRPAAETDEPETAQPLECGATSLLAQPIEAGVPVEGETTGSSELIPKSDDCPDGAGPEAVYYFDLDHKADLLWEVVPDFEGVAYIRAACDGLGDDGKPEKERACADREAELGVETAEARGASEGTWYLVVDGFENRDKGHYSATLRVREIVDEGGSCDPEGVLTRCLEGLGCNGMTQTCTQEQECDNITDDDGDGFIDCEDPDACKSSDACASGAALTGEPCTEPTDCFANDGDPFCWDEVQMGYPGGACAEFCNLITNDCGEGGTCVDFGLPSGNGLCLVVCEDSDECPDGYSCQLPMMATEARCLPACTDNAQCTATGHCNLDAGDCVTDFEECADDIDNDVDGRFDCGDLDCDGDTSCMVLVDATCDLATSFEDSFSGDTTGGEDLFTGSCTGGGRAPEALHTWTSDTDGFALFTLSSAVDMGIYVRETCSDPYSQAACADNEPAGVAEVVAVPVSADVPVTVFVDGFNSAAESGPYTVTATFLDSIETEPNDDADSADAWVDPFRGSIDPSGDEDWLSFEIDAASKVEVSVEGLADECYAGGLDPEVELYDADGTSLGFNDDVGTTNYCSRVSLADPEAGTYSIRISASAEYAPDATFPYSVTVTVTP